ncbi:MAG: DUF624 domain-containing protein [Ruminococcus sp.]|nr:DUF624 domain-containing protein [Ruminococcus sp.]
MEQTRKRMKFEILLERLFSNFHRVLFTNLLFFIPLAVAVGIYLLSGLFITNQVISTVVSLCLSVLVFPFYSGVVLVCRNIARGDKDVLVFSTFLKGVKENFQRFFAYGILLAFVAVFSYFSISVYSKLLSSSWYFYVLLFVCILIALEILFIFFSAPIMTVTFDLSFKHVMKNSFLMSFGEIKNNFFALFALIVVIAICFTVVAFCTNVYLLIIMTALLLALILPASCQFVVSFFVYDDMYATIAKREEKSEKIDQAIIDAKNRAKRVNENTEDYSDVDISTLKDTDEYIFYNGKMMKQSVLLRLAKEQRESTNTQTEKEK